MYYIHILPQKYLFIYTIDINCNLQLSFKKESYCSSAIHVSLLKYNHTIFFITLIVKNVKQYIFKLR
jgi:hypothetical protein